MLKGFRNLLLCAVVSFSTPGHSSVCRDTLLGAFVESEAKQLVQGVQRLTKATELAAIEDWAWEVAHLVYSGSKTKFGLAQEFHEITERHIPQYDYDARFAFIMWGVKQPYKWVSERLPALILYKEISFPTSDLERLYLARKIGVELRETLNTINEPNFWYRISRRCNTQRDIAYAIREFASKKRMTFGATELLVRIVDHDIFFGDLRKAASNQQSAEAMSHKYSVKALNWFYRSYFEMLQFDYDQDIAPAVSVSLVPVEPAVLRFLNTKIFYHLAGINPNEVRSLRALAEKNIRFIAVGDRAVRRALRLPLIMSCPDALGYDEAAKTLLIHEVKFDLDFDSAVSQLDSGFRYVQERIVLKITELKQPQIRLSLGVGETVMGHQIEGYFFDRESMLLHRDGHPVLIHGLPVHLVPYSVVRNPAR